MSMRSLRITDTETAPSGELGGDLAAALASMPPAPQVAAINTLGSQQREAVSAFTAWWRQYKRSPSSLHRHWFFLAGFAGVGKSTVLPFLLEAAGIKASNVSVVAPTGKAASVLRRKGFPTAGTLHGLIYRPEEADETEDLFFVRNQNSSVIFSELVVVDEVSMLTDTHVRDLLEFEVPVLFIGDPGQLPPVEGRGYFETIRPDFTLTEVHRQALESPILRAATAVRQELDFNLARHADGERLIVKALRGADMAEIAGYDVVLCGTHDFRRRINRRIRSELGREGFAPKNGDLVTVARNNTDLGVFNGVSYQIDVLAPVDAEKLVRTWRGKLPRVKDHRKKKLYTTLLDAVERDERWAQMIRHAHMSEVGGPHTHEGLIHLWRAACDDMDPAPPESAYDREAAVAKALRAAEVQFGYALTVHRSQGSSWAAPALTTDFPGQGDRKMYSRWLYTALTRASERMLVLDTAMARPSVHQATGLPTLPAND